MEIRKFKRFGKQQEFVCLLNKEMDSLVDDYAKRRISDLEAKLAESKKENERIKKNWQISKTHQQKLYNNLKQQNKKNGIVNYPITLDGCRIANEEQLLDFAKDFCLEKKGWEKQLAEKDQAIESLQEINQSLGQTCNNDAKEIERLRERLDDVLLTSIDHESYYATIDEYEKEIEELKQLQNQTAIAVLEKLLEKTQTLDVMVQSGHYINQKKVNVVFKDAIDQQIKELKGEK